MNRIRISCPHCRQLMEVRETDIGKKLRCAKCRQSFRHESTPETDVPSRKIGFPAGSEVIGVSCQKCEQKFGLKSTMSLKVIACPVCKAKQKFELQMIKDEAEQQHAADQEIGSANRNGPQIPQPVVKSKARPTNRATVVHSTDTQIVNPSELSARARELLPPKYLVADEFEQQALQESSDDSPHHGLSLGIDTARVRIRHGGEAVEVRSLTLDEKRRRRSLRVAMVYILSIVILIVWFVWLLNRFDSGE